MTKRLHSEEEQRTPCFLDVLPNELLVHITFLSEEVFKKFHCLSKQAAVSTHYNSDLQKCGLWPVWEFRTNFIMEICHFSNGLRDGVCKGWYKDGGRKIDMAYHKGLRQGVYKAWYKNGQIERQFIFYAGKKNGEFKSWHLNGSLKEHSFFEDGIKVGRSTSWYHNGVVNVDYFIADGVKHGEYKKFHDNGQMWEYIAFEEGRRHGEYKRWYKDGGVRQAGIYTRDSLRITI